MAREAEPTERHRDWLAAVGYRMSDYPRYIEELRIVAQWHDGAEVRVTYWEGGERYTTQVRGIDEATIKRLHEAAVSGSCDFRVP